MTDEFAETPKQETPFAQFETDWFPVRNSVIDYLMRHCTPPAFMVFMAIYRKTVGWHKSVDWISYSQIQKLTGLSRTAVWSALAFLTGEPSPRKPEPFQHAPKKPPKYKLINAITVGKKGEQKTYYSLNADLVIEIPKDEPEQQSPAYYKSPCSQEQPGGVVALSNQGGCRKQLTKDTLLKTSFDDDESKRISEILEQKTAIKPVNQQTINDLKELMQAKGLTIDDLIRGIDDHAVNPKAAAPTFSDIKGMITWAVTFKRNTKPKPKGKGVRDYRASWGVQDDEQEGELTEDSYIKSLKLQEVQP